MKLVLIILKFPLLSRCFIFYPKLWLNFFVLALWLCAKLYHWCLLCTKSSVCGKCNRHICCHTITGSFFLKDRHFGHKDIKEQFLTWMVTLEELWLPHYCTIIPKCRCLCQVFHEVISNSGLSYSLWSSVHWKVKQRARRKST